MPYRRQPIDEVCRDCHETAVLRCRRCGAPLCQEHAPESGSRCEPCEQRFAEGSNRAVLRLAIFQLLLAIVLIVALFSFLLESRAPKVLEPVPPLVTFVGVILMFGLPPLLLTPLRRAVFLLSRKRWRGVDD